MNHDDVSDRQITAVVFAPLVLDFHGGDLVVGTTATFILAGSNGSDNGPTVTVEVTITCHQDMSVADIEQNLMNKALAIVGRIQGHDPEGLLTMLRSRRKEAGIP